MTDKNELLNTFKYCQEVINGDNLINIAEKRAVKGYWGTAPTGRPHIAYLFPIIHISRLIKAGADMTILIADYHAALDNNKTEWEALHSRTDYYTIIIKELLSLTGVDSSKIRFVKGTDYQRGNPAYLDDLLKLSTKITVNIPTASSNSTAILSPSFPRFLTVSYITIPIASLKILSPKTIV